jgi:hypothetical protein
MEVNGQLYSQAALLPKKQLPGIHLQNWLQLSKPNGGFLINNWTSPL